MMRGFGFRRERERDMMVCLGLGGGVRILKFHGKFFDVIVVLLAVLSFKLTEHLHHLVEMEGREEDD